MARVLQVPAIPGSEALLALLTDDSAAKGYLQSMIDMRAEINDMVTAVGTIGEIDSLVVKTRSDREKATTILADAKAKAALILEAAKDKHAEATGELGKLADTAKDMERRATVRNKEMAQREKDVAVREETVAVREEDVSNTEQDVQSALAAAGESKEKYDKTLASIADVAQQAV